MISPSPPTLARFCKETLPLLHRTVRGERVLRRIGAIQKIDRWVSFDAFGRSAQHLAGLYQQVGVQVHVESISTGGRLGSGRWIIHEASDVRSATLEVLEPVRRRIADWRRNPFHIVQWSSATAPQGVTGELFILPSLKALEAIPAGGLAGKIVLTRQWPRQYFIQLSEKNPAAVICDAPVPGNPEAVGWLKFGWGGIAIGSPFHLVGMVLSQRQGEHLRALRRRGPVRLRLCADIRRYQGTHEMVNGVIAGSDPEAGELWVLAHSIEPGALDNASGVALCLEIAQVFEELIARGKLPRPRRAIRMMHGYECYSYFWALEHARQRYGQPVAGVVIDSVGSRPDTCNRRLEWHDTAASSAGFVDDIGAATLCATLKLDSAGYRLVRRPFHPTSDTLMSDPQYGFPCPWITTCVRSDKFKLYDAYHSSADTPAIMSIPGLKACTSAMAGYLYFLANLDNAQTLELAQAQVAKFAAALRSDKRDPRQAFARVRYGQAIEGLKKFVIGPDKRTMLAKLAALQGESPRQRRGSRRGLGRVPRRIALLTPTPENLPRQLVDQIQRSKLQVYALFWADGRRTLRQIRQLIEVESSQKITAAQVTLFFEAHAQAGYVAWA